jgi:hypothetical protein
MDLRSNVSTHGTLRTRRFYAVLFAKSVSFQRFVYGDDPRIGVALGCGNPGSSWQMIFTAQLAAIRSAVCYTNSVLLEERGDGSRVVPNFG